MSDDFDFSEVTRLAIDMGRGSVEVAVETRKVLQVGALRVKEGMRAAATGHPRSAAFPYSITYDTRQTAAGPVAEIGPDKNLRQGALGNILYFGTANNAPVISDMAAPARREAGVMAELLGAFAERRALG